ncbi:MAG: translation initiation factor IF-2, partial [Treponema sp.]|nr:translation initiation factor IF-2 [Treponema sp.]
ARGAQITDIVVLVVAADDGVMPQTLEAINHAKDAKVPIIVAVNKIDKPDANPDRVMTQLSEHGLTPEAWGGDTQYVNISALKREGIDDLLDAILIQAEVLELKAQYDCRAEGKVIESRIDQGRGVVATVVVERGTLRTGDPFVAGIYSGRVRAIFNDKGQKIKEATPSMPIEVLGIESMPNAGDPFQVTESERDARDFAAKRQELKRFEAAKAVRRTNAETLYTDIANSEVKEFKVIIKADLQGSAEALKNSLEKLSTKEIRLSVIHSSAGAINESDVTLAAADSNAIIIAFNVRPTPKAKALADQEKVEIRKYNIIYKCVEEIQAAMEGMLQPDTKEEVTGTLEVRNTFRVPKIGLIAGCYVTDGIIKKTSSVNVIRDGVVKFTGKVASLKHFKDDVKEVKYGFECGLGIENWQDIQVGDQIEAFEFVEVKRKLGDTLVDEKAAAEKREAERRAAEERKAAEAKAQYEAEQAAAKEAGKAKKAEEAARREGAGE